MRLLDYFRSSKCSSASKAKERLQVIIAHGRTSLNSPDYFPKLKQELLAVIQKYTKADIDSVQVTMEKEGNYEILELNVTIPND
ncbi:Cell division topological specificity factor MinE [hydrothermal vent metagenome]|uniref:Cell division topological specificity factor MinE n=1 Tax=hydrothermal vent metagenome TaxID=652676 RepID=A0A3B0YF00_9ZZZZ